MAFNTLIISSAVRAASAPCYPLWCRRVQSPARCFRWSGRRRSPEFRCSSLRERCRSWLHPPRIRSVRYRHGSPCPVQRSRRACRFRRARRQRQLVSARYPDHGDVFRFDWPIRFSASTAPSSRLSLMKLLKRAITMAILASGVATAASITFIHILWCLFYGPAEGADSIILFGNALRLFRACSAWCQVSRKSSPT